MKRFLCLFCFFISALFVSGQEIAPVVIDRLSSHPRLLFLQGQEKILKKKIKKDPLVARIYGRLLQEADQLLEVPVQPYGLTEGYVNNMLQLSREQIYRMITLSLAYRMTRDDRYLTKGEEELVNVCNYPNWNPRHYLDVAEMTAAVAIAYDWLYDDLKPATRQLVKKAIQTNALTHAVKEYAQGGLGSWAKRETNWNVVCNAGMVMGALAIAEEDTGLAEEIIRNAVKFVPNYLRSFAPDGVCYEGPAYWEYANSYLALMLSVLNDNLGQDFGLSGLPGINQTALYYVHSTSPAGRIFNFANCGSSASPAANPAYFFFSRHFRQPEVAAFYRQLLGGYWERGNLPRWFFFLALPWFDDALYQVTRDMARLDVYKSINDIAVVRGFPDTPHAIWLIAKGGDPDNAHQQMDVGTFIVETDGVRWSDDPGADSYDLPGFWDGRPDGKRWTYFRNNNFSHNTLAIDGKIQYAAGEGKIITYDKNSSQPYFVIDMTSVYQGQAQAVKRTFTLTDDKTVTVTDRVDLLNDKQEITWNMITQAQVSCEGNVARLSKDGKKFRLTILAPENAVFLTKPAKTTSDKEYPLIGYVLLQTKVSGSQEMEIKVQMNAE